MDEKSDADKVVDEVMLPGFRFHPTDEELVSFYLKSKIQQRPLPIELIKQVDIYKYDPWDLPKLATTGEKEWYFYCPRDRKYRNSARPNRVTGAGFWKATGTDRPIYSSDGTKCIGLKKSLVFYRGRAAKGMKTDWMMHEFRLPSSVSDSPPPPPRKLLDKSFPANDSWAICRIFKKANSTAQMRALSHTWVSPLPETTSTDMFNPGAPQYTQFSSENMSCTTETGSPVQLCCSTNDITQEIPSYKPIFSTAACKTTSPFPYTNDLPANFMFLPFEMTKSTIDVASMLSNFSPTVIGGGVGKSSERIDFEGGQQQRQFNGSFSISSSLQQHEIIQGNMARAGEEEAGLRKNSSATQVNNNQWESSSSRSNGFPFSFTSNISDGWKSDPMWDSPPCPSEMSTSSYSTNKCYT